MSKPFVGAVTGAVLGLVGGASAWACAEAAAVSMLVICTALSAPALAQDAKPEDALARLDAFVGAWSGTAMGQPGEGTVAREYERVLGGRFIRLTNRNSYPATEKNPTGDRHEDVGYFSFDRARKQYVLRQFHVEGFVNTYVADPPAEGAARWVFTSEAIENIAPGWRARETYTFHGPDDLEEVFELAAPGKEFEVYSRSRMKRQR
jgi:hypothetical protein